MSLYKLVTEHACVHVSRCIDTCVFPGKPTLFYLNTSFVSREYFFDLSAVLCSLIVVR